MEQIHYKTSELKDLGWTDGLIKKYLGEPDKYVKNPVYKSQAPMRLYLSDRVAQIIAQNNLAPVLASNLEKRVGRSLAAKKAADKKREEIKEWVENLTINVPLFSYADLIQRACQHYNNMQEWRMSDRGYDDYYFRPATPDSDSSFLYRITHNYLRHEETKYEHLIDLMFGQVGKEEAYLLLKEKVTQAIDQAYPELMRHLTSDRYLDNKNNSLAA